MSDATKQAVQDAIAAHIADENQSSGNSIEYLTDWQLVAAAAISDDVDHTSYWFLSNDGIPYHSQLGLLHRALQYVADR
ncbi:hypothetical protein J2T10_000078 [Paenarthrobacter nicotinovorans]|jgi:hypothetical protein|uniref:Uncharacterized protein n=1 Tax=Paenarthrobacter nicotinovorans TaxID=29320 RepID=A0ABT9TFP1_PAENI|nr:hypothetical protein [Paenarthrobacter nicotinovorans]MDQ0100459.1 hypothetical protein [Paenarthrobacter nicotinovorans]